jgi:hypothetical protein
MIDRVPSTLLLFGPPWFSFALGPMMKRRFGVPYVVDYIDPDHRAARVRFRRRPGSTIGPRNRRCCDRRRT